MRKTFTQGKYKGRMVHVVEQEDPGYCRWYAETVNSYGKAPLTAKQKKVRKARKNGEEEIADDVSLTCGPYKGKTYRWVINFDRGYSSQLITPLPRKRWDTIKERMHIDGTLKKDEDCVCPYTEKKYTEAYKDGNGMLIHVSRMEHNDRPYLSHKETFIGVKKWVEEKEAEAKRNREEWDKRKESQPVTMPTEEDLERELNATKR